MARLSEDLFEQAKWLVTREKKKPRQASVRRAVSTAYYALFHFISDKVTTRIIGGARGTADTRAWLGRALEHRTMKSACEVFARPNSPAFQALSTQLNFTADADLQAVADIFVNLQESRHRADYNLSNPITRSDAQIAITRVGSAFHQWNKVEANRPDLILIFSLCLLHWNNLKRS
jgi:uncharacterized protein (UPF0332 family)